MKKKCAVTGKAFEITPKDLDFYEKIGVPVPTLCPEERQRRRLAWRNEHHLYRRKCDATGKGLISMYDKKFPGKVYDAAYWWSDKWSAKDYGRDFDFNRPFFEQFNELFLEVPQANLRQINSENCAYCNYGFQNKNGYVSFSCVKAQDYYYCDTCTTINNCIDCLRVDESELCYECIDCQKGYELFFSQNCAQCRNSWFLKNCKSCKHCFGCTNLSHKEYWIYNKPYSKQDYEEFMKGFFSGKYSVIQKLVEQFGNYTKTQIHRATQNISVENCTGDYLLNSKNLEHCFEAALSEDCRHSSTFGWVQNCMDVNLAAKGSYLYESIGMDGYECAFDINVANNPQNVWYSMFVHTSQNCFGCCGLRNAKYSIFNKAYSKKDYLELREKIIAHMKETGEWGEFFPVKYSPFAYNETLAQPKFDNDFVKFDKIQVFKSPEGASLRG